MWILVLTLFSLFQEVPTSGIQAYVMVFSVADRDSFDEAILTLYELRKNKESKKDAVILVANKTGMVRNREVKEEGQFRLQNKMQFEKKYIEKECVKIATTKAKMYWCDYCWRMNQIGIDIIHNIDIVVVKSNTE